MLVWLKINRGLVPGTDVYFEKDGVSAMTNFHCGKYVDGGYKEFESFLSFYGSYLHTECTKKFRQGERYPVVSDSVISQAE